MAQTLLAVLLVLAGVYALPDLARLRDFSWLKALQARWPGAADDAAPGGLPLILLPALIALAGALVQLALGHVLFGLPAFAFAVAALFYSWGPRELEADIEAVLKAPDSDRRYAAAQALRADASGDALPWQAAALVEAAFAAALSRWFGVLFWFVVLGPGGALGYRAVQLLARHPAFAADVGATQRRWLERAALVLDWVPSHLIALTLALVSDFDAVVRTWRDYHAARRRGYFTLDLGFLGAIARSGVDADVVAGDGYAADVNDPLVELADARAVLRRVLVTWLALIALLALAGWVS